MGFSAALVIVAARELARAGLILAAGGAAQTTVVWTFGAFTDHPAQRDSRREYVAACGGLAFNLMACPALAAWVRLTGLGWDYLVFNPFDAASLVSGLTVAQSVAWWAYVANAAIFAANLAVPSPPFDLSRILRCGLRRGLGEDRAAAAIGRLGVVVSVLVVATASATGHPRVLGLGVVSCIVAWVHLRRVAFRVRPGTFDRPAAFDRRTEDIDLPKKLGENRGTDPRSAGEPELDDVLGTISRDGSACLTTREREVLRRATERRRSG